jgi:hypothetical protein
MIYVRTSALYDFVSGDARFRTLLRQMNFP